MRRLRGGSDLPQVPTNLPTDRPGPRAAVSASAGRDVRSRCVLALAYRLPVPYRMSTRLPESPSGAARWLQILLAAALVLLVPLALYATWAQTPQLGIFDDDNDIDDDACEIQIGHVIWIAEDRASVVAAPRFRFVRRSHPVSGRLVTVWPGCPADERAPPRA